MLYGELFDWWFATITWSIVFPIAVSAYLYRRRPSKGTGRVAGLRLIQDFTFVWFLLGILAFYVISVSQGSALLFALGNIVLEVLLLLYVGKVSKVRRPSERDTREVQPLE